MTIAINRFICSHSIYFHAIAIFATNRCDLDPAKRIIVRIRIDDAVEADRMFTILMGDEVEPRRRFIEENAQYVKNLDV
jgi:DNA gyrase/topoisomerase IV subunit B